MADLTITTADIGSNKTITAKHQCGEAIAEGEFVYLSSAKLYLTDLTDAAKDDVYGIALAGGSTNDWITVAVGGPIVLGATMTVGETYILSEAGKISPIADVASTEYVTWVFVAETATTANLNNMYASGVQRA